MLEQLQDDQVAVPRIDLPDVDDAFVYGNLLGHDFSLKDAFIIYLLGNEHARQEKFD
jgi:hypothetical protein